MVQDLLAGFRSGHVTPEGLPVELSRLRREMGRVLVDTLFQELRGCDHKDRHLATICLQIIADDEVERRALDVLRRRSSAAHTKVGAIEILETLGYSQEDLLPQIPYIERPSIAEAMLENYILLVNDPLTLGGMLSQFMDLPPEQQETYLDLFADSGDPRVVDFLWYVSQTGAEQARVRARDALGALSRAGVDIGEGPTRSLLSLLEEQVGTDIAGEELLEWGYRCVRDGDLVMAEACFREYIAEGFRHGSAMLQLATILASQDKSAECRDMISGMERELGRDHFQVVKAGELLAVLGEADEVLLPLDDVEAAIDVILGGLVPTTPHQYHMAILMWNQFVRFSRTPIRTLKDPLGWAAAVIYNLRRMTGLHTSMADLARRISGLGEIRQPTVLGRARRMRLDLDLETGDGAEWLERELRARIGGDAGDDDDDDGEAFPDWMWLSDYEIGDLSDYRLWVALYSVQPGMERLLAGRPELEPGPADPELQSRVSFDWKAPPVARPYNLGPLTRARFLLDPAGNRLAVITLSTRDLLDARDLIELIRGARVKLKRIASRPLREIAGQEMLDVALGRRSGFELEVRLDMMDLDSLE